MSIVAGGGNKTFIIAVSLIIMPTTNVDNFIIFFFMSYSIPTSANVVNRYVNDHSIQLIFFGCHLHVSPTTEYSRLPIHSLPLIFVWHRSVVFHMVKKNSFLRKFSGAMRSNPPEDVQTPVNLNGGQMRDHSTVKIVVQGGEKPGTTLVGELSAAHHRTKTGSP